MTVAGQLANNTTVVTATQSVITAVNEQINNIILSFSDWMYGLLNLVNNINKQKQAYLIILIVFIVVIVLIYIGMVYTVYQ